MYNKLKVKETRNYRIALHTLTGRSSKSLIVYKFLKKYQHVHVQRGKSIFIPECEYPRMRAWKPDLIMQKDRHAL